MSAAVALLVYGAGVALFVVGALTVQTWVLAAGVVLVASGIAVQNAGEEHER